MEEWTMDNKKHEKELKELSRIIIEALTNNKEVMGLLADLKERKIIESTTLLGLALKVNDLLEISGATFTKEELQKENKLPAPTNNPPRANDPDTATNNKELIDGRELTPSEMAFERWSRENFDVDQWLRKSGLIW